MRVIFSKYANPELEDAIHYYELNIRGLAQDLKNRTIGLKGNRCSAGWLIHLASKLLAIWNLNCLHLRIDMR